MGVKKLTKLPSLSNVVAGSQASLRCPVGLTYDKIHFVYDITNDITTAQIQNIEVRVNGKAIQKYASGTELNNLNQYYGRTAVATSGVGVLTLYFIRPELENVSLWLSRLTALGTQDVDTLDIVMDIDSGAALAAGTITAYAELSEATPLGIITKVKSFPVTFATSGQQEIDTLPKGDITKGVRVAALHLSKTADDITAVEVEVNGVKIHDSITVLSEAMATEYGRTPIATYYHLDFMLEGDINRALSTLNVQDWRFKPTMTTSGAVGVLVEYLDVFDGI